jgi:hypothetical protein
MLYFSHPSSVEHDPRAHMPAHPDTPERLIAIERVLADRQLGGDCDVVEEAERHRSLRLSVMP